MKLIDLWNVADGQKIFINKGYGYDEVMDGPGFPVVNRKDASDMVVEFVRPETYPMYGNVLEIVLAE